MGVAERAFGLTQKRAVGHIAQIIQKQLARRNIEIFNNLLETQKKSNKRIPGDLLKQWAKGGLEQWWTEDLDAAKAVSLFTDQGQS